MKWVKRGCWVAAWGVWVWLGLGLYRELPRNFEKGVKLDAAFELPAYGFIGDSHEVVVSSSNRGPKWGRQVFQIFDADTGRLIREFSHQGLWATRDGNEFRRGVAFVNSFADDPKDVGFFCIDLISGASRKVSSMLAKQVALHESHPWVAFREEDRFFFTLKRLVVCDWSNCEEIFFLNPGIGRENLVGDHFFLPDSDRLVVQRGPITDKANELGVIEIWEPSKRPRMVKALRGSVGVQASLASGGRIAYLERVTGPSTIDIFDIEIGQRVFSHPPQSARGKSDDRHPRRPLLFQDGRSVCGGEDGSIFDVESGQVLWPRYSHESVMFSPAPDQFCVYEQWHELSGFKFPWRFETFATRDYKGALMFRSWEDVPLNPAHRSSDGKLLIDWSNVQIIRLPLLVNYPLLAICQTILALPLVFLWAILRWRRNRRLRLASVTP